MGLLDHLRSQPRWKSPDPLERAAAARDLADDQAEVIRSLARDDADARVRRAALRRLDDPQLLAEAARSDGAEAVRRDAESLLQAIALKTDDPVRGAAALAGLQEAKRLARVAQAAALAEVRRAALARLDEPRALVSVARRALDRGARLEAVRRLSDPADLADVAVRCDHEETALAAVEAILDRPALKTAAARARNKAVAERARARLDELGPEPQPVDPDAVRARRAEICQDLEFLRHSENDDLLRAGLEALEESWRGLDPPIDEDLGRRFAAALSELRARLSRHDRQRAEEDRRSRAIESARAARRRLCEAVEAAPPAQAPGAVARARSEWDALDPGDRPELGGLEGRFTAACEQGLARHAAWSASLDRRARMEAICREAESAVAADAPPLPDGRWQDLRREWAATAAGGGEDAGLVERFEAAVARHSGHEAERKRAERRRLEENLERLEALCAAREATMASEGLTIREADAALREIAAAMDEPLPLPTPRDAQRVSKRLKRLRAALGARVRELRETVEWKRWASANILEDLCARVEAMRTGGDLAAVSRQLRDIERQWRQARGRPGGEPPPLAQRFQAARDEVRARCDAFFAQQAEAQAENLKRKEDLCARAEALAESTDWVRAAGEIKGLQAEWKQIGTAPRPQMRQIWRRFRAPCDRFFTRRKEDLESRRRAWAQNEQRKTALCERAEALAESADWDQTAAELKRLQAEWKTLGPVRRNRSEALWVRLRRACDRFFERHARRDALDREAGRAEREAVCVRMEALLTADGPAPPDGEGLAEQVRRARADFLRGAPDGSADERPLRDRFETALRRVVSAHPETFRDTDLDCDFNRRRMEQLCEQVEGLLASAGAAVGTGVSPAAILAAHWREAMASNTIGGGQEARRRAAAELKSAQSAWRRLGPVPGEAGETLARRFDAACRRLEQQGAGADRSRRS